MAGDLWYCSGRLDADPLEALDLGWVGPAPEDDLEDGLEADLRPSLRPTGYRHWERREESLPDIEELWALDQVKGVPKKRTLEVVAARQLARQEQKERAEEDVKRYRRIKYAAKARRRKEQAAAWRARMHERYPDDPRWSSASS